MRELLCLIVEGELIPTANSKAFIYRSLEKSDNIVFYSIILSRKKACFIRVRNIVIILCNCHI